MTGTVKSYSCRSGYGFIKSDNRDYFFRYSDILNKSYPVCRVGEQVSFSPSRNDRGLCATLVEAI